MVHEELVFVSSGTAPCLYVLIFTPPRKALINKRSRGRSEARPRPERRAAPRRTRARKRDTSHHTPLCHLQRFAPSRENRDSKILQDAERREIARPSNFLLELIAPNFSNILYTSYLRAPTTYNATNSKLTYGNVKVQPPGLPISRTLVAVGRASAVRDGAPFQSRAGRSRRLGRRPLSGATAAAPVSAAAAVRVRVKN